jgi:hypothetical protein
LRAFVPGNRQDELARKERKRLNKQLGIGQLNMNLSRISSHSNEFDTCTAWTVTAERNLTFEMRAFRMLSPSQADNCGELQLHGGGGVTNKNDLAEVEPLHG